MNNITLGQIHPFTQMGMFLRNITLVPHIKTIVEIGTFNGTGSSLPVILSIAEKLQKNKGETQFYTIEMMKDKYKLATEFWENQPYFNWNDLKKSVHLLNGIIDLEDIENYKKNDLACVDDLRDQIPKDIDLVILDGWSNTIAAWDQYIFFKDRTKIIFLDDTNSIKNRTIKADILKSNKWKVLLDVPFNRNGMFCACIPEIYDTLCEFFRQEKPGDPIAIDKLGININHCLFDYRFLSMDGKINIDIPI